AQDIRHINPPGLSKSPAYSQAVTAKPGRIVWISGQVGENAKGELAGKDLKSQVNQAWTNVKAALEGAGATFQDVVKITTYVVNYKPSMRPELREARLHAMGTAEPPAATLVGVQSLASEEWLVEIEVTAVVR
ncbi:MAG: RidA family protein, partial [Candidatus Solibacter sp.]|nr:RidA family protein [Candidatus Solibacter sp.]